jgi:hypothetical protein
MTSLKKEIKQEEKLLSELDLKVVDLDSKNGDDDFSLLADDLKYLLEEKLTEKGFKFKDLKVLYSLGYSQGDGFCFIGEIETKKAIFKIEHSNSHYYHENSTDIDITDLKVNKQFKPFYDLNKKQQDKAEVVLNDFIEVYKSICKEMAKTGYNIIEEQEQENVLRRGFNDFLSKNNLEEEDLFNFDYKTQQEKGFVKVCDSGNTNIKGLWIKNQKVKVTNNIKVIAEIKEYQTIEFI